jgi:23S rRNA (cytosine1962-C5)-methyltransferase
MNGLAGEKLRDPALVDFGVDAAGHGRRLERLAGLLVDRPLPQADHARRRPAAWAGAAAVYRASAGERGRGDWEFTGPLPDPWLVHVPVGPATLALEVRPAPSGQIGVFLEQVEQWRWLAGTTPRGAVMLSLFGHSGAATLALAAAGAEVVHVDASKQAIALARRNAAASGLADLPVRWVCEDAATFVARQARRGARFSGAVLDPPSWGHGPRGEAFAIDRDLASLVDAVAGILAHDTGPPAGPLLLTCHSPAWHHRRLRDTLVSACAAAGLPPGRLESGRLGCLDDSRRTLDLGDFARRTPPA